MSRPMERTIRLVRQGEPEPKRVRYWRTRPLEERLFETLSLHREGNDLFLGGNPAFTYELRIRDVGAAR